MNKSLCNAFMKRTKLKNDFLRYKTEENERFPIKDDNNNDFIRDPVFRSIVKHEARPRIMAITKNCVSGTRFRIISVDIICRYIISF